MKTEAVKDGCGPVIRCACGCGALLTMYDERKRPRQFVSGHHVRLAWQAVKRSVLPKS